MELERNFKEEREVYTPRARIYSFSKIQRRELFTLRAWASRLMTLVLLRNFRFVDNNANTSKQTTTPFLTVISLSCGQFLLFPFSLILHLTTLLHNLRATKSSVHCQYGYKKKKNIQSWECTRHSSVGGRGCYLNYSSISLM